MRVAVVLMVRNEVDDILPWLAWQKLLGVDTIIVFDDGSSDGTTDIIEQAAPAFDIRLRRLASSNELYTRRQDACYKHVLGELRDEYDWIGFFDADEYIFLAHHATIKDFLDRDPDVGAVAVNWCNYSSGGHVVKPTEFPTVAYKEHFAPNSPIGKHVKSFVRPSAWTKTWTNVHHFDVHPLRYVLANGDAAQWGNTPGLTQGDPDWSVAKVMHYQCRSMEHFVERARRRHDLRVNTTQWTTLNENGQSDSRPSARTGELLDLIGNVLLMRHEGVIDLVLELARGGHFSPTGASDPSARAEPRIGRLIVSDGATLVRTANGEIIASDRAEGHSPIYAIRSARRPSTVLLSCFDLQGSLLAFRGDPRLSACPTFDLVEEDEDNGTFALRVSSTTTYVCAEPMSVGGRVTADRALMSLWERFKLGGLSGSDKAALSDHPGFHLLTMLDGEADHSRELEAAAAGPPGTWIMALLPFWSRLLPIHVAKDVSARLGGLSRYYL